MQNSPLLIAALLGWLLLVAGVLRVMAIAKRVDALAERHWAELAQLHSESGAAFFPTPDARLELEMAISEVVEIERKPVRRRTARAGLASLYPTVGQRT